MENTIPSMKLVKEIHDLLLINHLGEIEICPFTPRQYYFQKIKQINNIPVNVILFCQFIDMDIGMTANIYYLIVSNVTGLNNNILYHSHSYHNIDTLMGFKECLQDLYIKLPQFVICINSGKMYIPIDNNIDEELGGEYLLGQECSVCLEKTITKTPCHHSLCIHCWSKIGKIVKCPICRRRILSTTDIFIDNYQYDVYLFDRDRNGINDSSETDQTGETGETGELGQTSETDETDETYELGESDEIDVTYESDETDEPGEPGESDETDNLILRFNNELV